MRRRSLLDEVVAFFDEKERGVEIIILDII